MHLGWIEKFRFLYAGYYCTVFRMKIQIPLDYPYLFSDLLSPKVYMYMYFNWIPCYFELIILSLHLKSTLLFFKLVKNWICT